VGKKKGEIGAPGDQLSVGEVDEPENAVNHGEAHREKGVDRPCDHAVDKELRVVGSQWVLTTQSKRGSVDPLILMLCFN
jgi:hypothetical protein